LEKLAGLTMPAELHRAAEATRAQVVCPSRESSHELVVVSRVAEPFLRVGAQRKNAIDQSGRRSIAKKNKWRAFICFKDFV